MYTYGLFKTDIENTSIFESMEQYNTSADALVAAYDELSTRYIHDWPVEIRIYEEPSHTVMIWEKAYEMDVNIRALARIDRANRPEFHEVINNARNEGLVLDGQLMQGLITPLEYARALESLWIRTRVDIESRV